MQPKIPPVIWFVIGLLLLLSSITLVVAFHNPSGRSYPNTVSGMQGPKGDTPIIDYSKLATEIIKVTPKPIIPQNGTNGTSGKNGVNGANGAQGLPGAMGSDSSVPGPTGATGPQGEPGASGKIIEIRYNLVKAQIEYRYEGDFTWTPLVTACTLTNTCIL